MSDPRQLKTSECMWCGLSEAMGAKLNARPACFGGNPRFECADKTVCDKRIKSRILMGAAPGGGVRSHIMRPNPDPKPFDPKAVSVTFKGVKLEGFVDGAIVKVERTPIEYSAEQPKIRKGHVNLTQISKQVSVRLLEDIRVREWLLEPDKASGEDLDKIAALIDSHDQAAADQIYLDNGILSAAEVRSQFRETDADFRRRLLYVAGDGPNRKREIETASGSRLDELAVEYGLKRL